MQVTANATEGDVAPATPHAPGHGPSARASRRHREPTRNLLPTLLIVLLAPAAVALTQDNPPPTAVASQADPLSAFNKRAYGQLKNWLLRSAEKMPEDDYNFKPTDAVRSFGQVVGHLADAQYLFCSSVLGEKSPAPRVEQSKTSKADLVAALRDAFAYCDRAYDGLTDASALQMVKLFREELPKLAVLTANDMHCAEHYGNLVTYMRLKNVVPPSSEPAGGS